MSVPLYKVWLYPTEDLDGGSIDITYKLSSWQTEANTKGKTGAFSIEVPNTSAGMIGSIEYGDKIKFQAGDSTGYEDILFAIVEDEADRVSNNNTLSYKGIDYARKLMDFFVSEAFASGVDLGSLWQLDSDGAGSTLKGFSSGSTNSALVVQYMLNSFYEYNNSIDALDYVEYVDRDKRLGIGLGCKGWAEVDVFSNVGSGFFKSFSKKRLNEAIIEVSSNNWTGNGDYNFFVDESRKVHFEKTVSKNYNKVLREGEDIISLDAARNVNNRFNIIVVNAGDDWSGNPIFATGWNETAIIQYGYKYGYVDKKGIFSAVSRAVDNGGLSGAINPKTSTEYTWLEIKTMALKLGEAIATDIALKEGLPKWEVSVNIPGTNNFKIGSAYLVDIESDRWYDKQLRLTGVKHKFDRSGWITQLKLTEDSGEIR